MRISYEDILKAKEKIGKDVIHTPMIEATRLSSRSEVNIWLKLENLQHTAAFKARGALNKLINLSEKEKKKGVIACSAGNHAQGVAYNASRLGIPSIIVMPKGTPFNKIQKTEEFGAKVDIYGNNFDEAAKYTKERSEKEGLTYIHPFDDDYVVAGQGTIAMEMLEDIPNLDAIIVPIGGGGLISGIAVAAKNINPDIKIIGAQTELYDAAKRINSGNHDIPQGGGTLAEGIAVKYPSEKNMEIINTLVDEIFVLSEVQIEEAVFHLLSAEKMVAEGAAGAALAVVLEYPEKFKDKKVGIVISGGNIDSRILSTLIMRGMVRDGRITRLRFEIDDTPGQLADISRIIGEEGANVIEVIHQRMMQAVPLKRAELDVVIEARDEQHAHEIVEELRNTGFIVHVMNELA